MKALVVYSTLTGNTRKVAEALFKGLPEGSVLADLKDNPDPSGFDSVFVGFWVDKGKADAATLKFLENLKDKPTAIFFTLGAYPDSPHADSCAKETEELIVKNNNRYLGHYRCQGKVDPELVEKMKKMLPPDHPHAQMTPERQARLDEASKHPDEADLEKALNFAKEVLAKL
ncbi:MAG: flavodoxin family protein [Deltaproteobacteria bacterium]|jgi:flavodoxin|nr:flavodoxin family protein [Deltaproteobacteria bacterium]